jgi:hypothetical protein
MHFWLLWARLSFARSELGSTVPRKIDLYWVLCEHIRRDIGLFGTNLIHACIGKEKGWILIRNGGGRRDVSVAVGLKVVEESLTNLRRRERTSIRRHAA